MPLDHYTPDQHPQHTDTTATHDALIDSQLQDDLDRLDLAITTPSRGLSKYASASAPLSSTENGKGKGRRVSNWKARRGEAAAVPGEDCYLLNLPNDLLHLVLARLPPRALLRLGATCQLLHEELKDHSIWRQSYANRFLWDGAARDGQAKDEVKVLVQGCLNTGGRGWKREALSREAMIDRWTGSKAPISVHTPPTGLIDSLSLSYPPFIPAPPRQLVVGKNHPTPSRTKAASASSSTSATPQSPTPHSQDAQIEAGPSTPTSAISVPSQETGTPTPKMTHRQKYEALLAATTRPPPYVLSASLAVGGVVRSDPISGKVSKGYWGPGRDANLHLRPHLDSSAEPSAVYLPPRVQTHVLWGLRTGSVVHTSMQSRHHATHGGRASSRNVQSKLVDSHQGDIVDIWSPEAQDRDDGTLRWVTGGADGRVKLWHMDPGTNPTKPGKKSPNVESIPPSIACLFTSRVVDTAWSNRSDGVKRRQAGSPDAVILTRYDVLHDVSCGVTVDGDLRVWFDVTGDSRQEVRVDVGSEEAEGGVRALELDARTKDGAVTASILVHHRRSPLLTRYDITASGVERSTTFVSPTGSALTVLHASLRPTPAIASQSDTVDSTPLFTPSETPSTASPSALDLSVPTDQNGGGDFGRFVIAGDESGYVHVWGWEGDGKTRGPIRSWEAMNGKITSLESSCGLIAVGSFDGYIKIYDPLPSPPTLLRTFHASRLTPAEQMLAATDEPDGRYYTVNNILLDNDLVVAAIGRKVFAWRAGSGKGRQNGKDGQGGWRRSSAGRNEGKGTSRGVVMKALHNVAAEDHAEIQASSSPQRARHEQRELAAMEQMGLEDGDDALQYALMMSMEEAQYPDGNGFGGASTSDYEKGLDGDEEGLDEEAREAIRQVEAFKRAEEEEMERVLRAIRQAEERERQQTPFI